VKYMKATGYNGGNVRLAACWTGRGQLPQLLAQRLANDPINQGFSEIKVLAPTNRAEFFPFPGDEIEISAGPPKYIGGVQVSPGGVWQGVEMPPEWREFTASVPQK
jgi:hypothetical protein